MDRKGKFIVFEGQGYTGKSEQSPLLKQRLLDSGISVIETQEPGGVASAIAIRDEILAKRGTISAEAEMALFYQSRQKFLDELVRPALKSGDWVVSTRFSASTFVYQGREGGIPKDVILALDESIVGETQPDLYILVDCDPKEIIRRMGVTDARTPHSFNDKDIDKLIKRRSYYLDLAKENIHKNWIIVDGNESIDKVHKIVWSIVTDKFGLNDN